MQGGGGARSADKLDVIRAALEAIADAEEIRRRSVTSAGGPRPDDKTGETLRGLCELASILRRQGDFEEAERVLVEAVTTCTASLGHETVDAAAVLRNLGLLYQEWGRFEAEATYHRALGAVEALLTAQAKYEEAEPLLRQAVAAFDAAFGHDSNEMAVSASQLASLLNATDRSEEAVELYRRVLQIRRDQLGSSHPTVVSTLHNLALACDAAGRTDEAQILWDEARAVLETTKQATP